MDNTAVESLAQSYEANLAAGRAFIRDFWPVFRIGTKEWLIQSSHYDDSGHRRDLDYGEGSEEVERLAYQLGCLRRCVLVVLPGRGVAHGSPIAGEAAADEVLASAAAMLCGPCSHEPEFLRLGLQAVRQHQMANLLCRLPSLSGFGIPPVWAALRALLFFLSAFLTPILVLTLPALLGYAITSGAKGDMAGAIASCYAIGFILLLTAIMRNLGKEKELTPDEVAYGGWEALGNP
uniref:hypothetical protein n=1 Tax=Accumulibacter sp. TaxID=2053492 RepID=UPI00259106F3